MGKSEVLIEALWTTGSCVSSIPVSILLHFPLLSPLPPPRSQSHLTTQAEFQSSLKFD